MEESTLNQQSTPATPNTPAQPTSTDTASSGTPKREYTQAELDDMFQDRAKRAETATITRLLKLLGVSSEAELPTLKTTIEKAREIEQANLSVTEKAEKAAAAALERANTLESQLNAERTERRQDRIAAHLQGEAAKLKANDAETVLMYARDKHKAALDATLNEDGTFNADKVKALLETIRTEKAHYFTPVVAGAGIPSNNRGQPVSPDARLLEQAKRNTQQQVRKNF